MAGQPFWGGASAEGPTFSEDPFDVVFIGGDPLPGVCEVKGIAQLEIDKKKVKGTNGHTITVTGFQPGPFEVTVTVWTSEQDEFLQAWLDKFWIGPQKDRPKTTKRVRTGTTQVEIATGSDGKPITQTVPTFANVSVKGKTKNSQVTLDISHPRLAKIGITTCVVQGVSIPEPGSFDGSEVIKIKLIDGRANEKKDVTKTAKGSRVNVASDPRVSEQKSAVPPKPSGERADLGPKGPRPKPASGSD